MSPYFYAHLLFGTVLTIAVFVALQFEKRTKKKQKLNRIKFFFERNGVEDFNEIILAAKSAYPFLFQFEAINAYYYKTKEEIQNANRAGRVPIGGKSELTEEIMLIQEAWFFDNKARVASMDKSMAQAKSGDLETLKETDL